MAKYHELLKPDGIFHVYSRAVGQEKLFKNEENYRFFLSKYKLHITPVADTFAWCLLPNHFHFLIQIKSFESIKALYKTVKRKDEFSFEQSPDFIMERFSNWLNSYTKAFNKVYERKGSLFIDYMRRVQVDEDEQLAATIFYIHKNPVHHGLVKNIEDWEWSSFKSHLSSKETSLQRDKVLNVFQGIDGFKEYHKQTIYLKSAAAAED